MSQHQSGILPEHSRFAIWLEATVQGDLNSLRQGVKAFHQQLTQLRRAIQTRRWARSLPLATRCGAICSWLTARRS